MSDTATILGPNGEPLTEKPMTRLSLEEAQLLRDYAEWGGLHGYQAEMVCGKCGKAMETYVQGDVGIFCDCRMLIWQAS